MNRVRLAVKQGVGASRVVLPSGKWSTIFEFLLQRFNAVPRDEWSARIERGDVLDDRGMPLSIDAPYRVGATVYYYRHVHDELHIPVEERVLFRDELLVVADKPHFLPVVSTGRFVRESLLARLKRKLQLDTLAPLHRIDRETAGLVLFTVQPATRDRYAALFRDRAVHKYYEAIAPLSSLKLPAIHRSRLEEGEHHMQMREVEGEANAETRIELSETRGQLARYRLMPITGKKHQLRAHLSALGMPIINDRIYPTLRLHEPDDYSRPLQLLAKQLQFVDPITGRRREFTSERELILPHDGA